MDGQTVKILLGLIPVFCIIVGSIIGIVLGKYLKKKFSSLMLEGWTYEEERH